ncbi:MAG: polysaccharide biosynthesis/export family protein [Terriglobales bacterium]
MRRGLTATCGLVLAGALLAVTGAGAQSPRGVKTVPAAATPPRGPAAVKSAADPEYVLGPGDVLSIDVWKQPEISRTLPVRPDGRISLPLVGEVMAAGKTAHQLRVEIGTRLKKYIDDPTVTVMVTDAQSQRFVIVGRVLKPGTYSLAHPETILDAIAMAGGLSPFANGKKIYLLRKRKTDGVMLRYNFNYHDVSLGLTPRENIALQPGDIIVVP